MDNLVTSIIRTFVPAFVGAFAAILAGWGLPLDDVALQGLQAFVMGITAAIYYTGVRVAAQKYPKLEWLLGSPKTPTYKG